MAAAPVPPARGFSRAMSVSEAHEGTAFVEKPFGRALLAEARRRPEVVGLTGDLGKYTDMDLFAAEFPDRYFNMGMAEQNLVGAAAGLARVGFLPFVTTYCVFAGRRAFDFVAIAVSEGRANVKLVCGLPGLTTGYGATHQGIDDLALMRAIPGLVVIDPCDAVEIEKAVPVVAAFDGPVYMRLLRGRVPKVLPDDTPFEIGAARRLRDGGDILFVSTGLMTGRALEAADLLAQEGIAAGVLHVPTLKPFDREAIAGEVARCPRVVTMENHSLVGGLASAVAEVIVDSGLTVRMERIGMPDRYLECGSVPYLTEKYGLTAQHAVGAAKRVLACVDERMSG